MAKIQILASLSLFASLGLWITALFTSDWLDASYIPKHTISKVFNLKLGLIESTCCKSNSSGKTCYVYFPEDIEKRFNSDNLPSLIEQLIKSITAVVLTGACCLSVMLLDACSRKRKAVELLIVILSCLSVLLEAYVIIQMTYLYEKTAQSNFPKICHGTIQYADFYSLNKTPYSIVIACLGCLFGISGIISRVFEFKRS